RTSCTSHHCRVDEPVTGDRDTHGVQHPLLEAGVVRHDDPILEAPSEALVGNWVGKVEDLSVQLLWFCLVLPSQPCQQRLEGWAGCVVVQPSAEQVGCSVGLEVETNEI